MPFLEVLCGNTAKFDFSKVLCGQLIIDVKINAFPDLKEKGKRNKFFANIEILKL